MPKNQEKASLMKLFLETMRDIKKILAVRNDRFGEFLLNIPAFRALKEKYTQAKITLVVNPYVKELAECIAVVDEVITWESRRHKFGEILKLSRELRSGKFDLCVIFNPSKEFNIISFLSGIPIRVGYARKLGILLTHKLKDEKYLGLKHEIEYNLDLVSLVGAETQDKELSLEIEDDTINSLFKEFGIKESDNLVAVHPLTSDPIKQWPQQYFIQLVKRLTMELDVRAIVIGATEEVSKQEGFISDVHASLVNMINKTNLRQLAAVLKKCKLLISGDSGPVHLASCVGTPVVAIFRNDMPGKSSVRWGPASKGSVVIQKTNISDILIDEVFDKAKEVLQR